MRLHAFAALGLCFLAAAPARGAVTAYVYESGLDVILSYSGDIDLTGYDTVGPFTQVNQYFAQSARGFANTALYDKYVFNTPNTLLFGGSGLFFADSGAGDDFYVNGSSTQTNIAVPQGYVSGGFLAGSLVFDGTALGDLQLSAGTYQTALGNGDTVTVIVGQAPPAVPAPPAGVLLLGALGAAAAGLRRSAAG